MTALLTAGSLALNIALLAWLVCVQPPSPGAPNRSRDARHARTVRTPPAPVSQAASASATNADSPPAFDWSRIESADYRQYLANLRAIGCPEPVIRDIIAADLAQAFGQRARAIWKQPAPARYWQKPRRDRADADQVKALEALGKEHAAAYKELLGAAWDPQQTMDLLFLQLHGAEQQFLFLPPDKREAALGALADTDYESKAAERYRAGYDPNAEQRLLQEQMKVLAGVLSPDELQEFRLRNSGTVERMRTELQYFDCTREEFTKLLDLREQSHTALAGGDLLNRTAATAQIRDLFGDARAKEFERVTDLFYINARRATETEGLPVERADEAWQLVSAARAAADRIAADRSLAADERRRLVQALRDQTDARLADVLGANGARGITRDFHLVLSSTTSGIQP